MESTSAAPPSLVAFAKGSVARALARPFVWFLSAIPKELGPVAGTGVLEADGATKPALGLGLIEAASAPTFALRPHHCGSAMVAMALQPDSASSVPEMAAGAGPQTKEK